MDSGDTSSRRRDTSVSGEGRGRGGVGPILGVVGNGKRQLHTVPDEPAHSLKRHLDPLQVEKADVQGPPW